MTLNRDCLNHYSSVEIIVCNYSKKVQRICVFEYWVEFIYDLYVVCQQF